MGWNKPAAIIGRRKKEQKLFATGNYGDIEHVSVYDKFPGKARRMSTAEVLGASRAPPDVPAVPAPVKTTKWGGLVRRFTSIFRRKS